MKVVGVHLGRNCCLMYMFCLVLMVDCAVGQPSKASNSQPGKVRTTWADLTKALEGTTGIAPKDETDKKANWTRFANKVVEWEGVLEDAVGENLLATINMEPALILLRGTENKKAAFYLSLKVKAADVDKWKQIRAGERVKFRAIMGALKAFEGDTDAVYTFLGSLTPGKEFGTVIVLARDGEVRP